MMNLNEMTSKQLKELGKQYGVKNWWNLSKAALISALSEIENHEAEQENVKAHEEAEPVIEPENEVVVSAPAEIEDLEDDKTNTQAEAENKPEIEPESKKKKPNLKIHELTFEGKTQSIRAWAEELEMPWPTLYDRVNRCGWTTEEALTIPLGARRKNNKKEKH